MATEDEMKMREPKLPGSCGCETLRECCGEPDGCDSPICGEHPEAQPIGNAAAMYAALKEMHALLVSGVYDGAMDCHEALKIVEKALSAPPRNCDVGTAEEQDKRYAEFCGSTRCGRCPLYGSDIQYCEIAWGQIPYTDAAGERSGSAGAENARESK